MTLPGGGAFGLRIFEPDWQYSRIILPLSTARRSIGAILLVTSGSRYAYTIVALCHSGRSSNLSSIISHSMAFTRCETPAFAAASSVSSMQLARTSKPMHWHLHRCAAWTSILPSPQPRSTTMSSLEMQARCVTMPSRCCSVPTTGHTAFGWLGRWRLLVLSSRLSCEASSIILAVDRPTLLARGSQNVARSERRSLIFLLRDEDKRKRKRQYSTVSSTVDLKGFCDVSRRATTHKASQTTTVRPPCRQHPQLGVGHSLSAAEQHRQTSFLCFLLYLRTVFLVLSCVRAVPQDSFWARSRAVTRLYKSSGTR